MRFGSEVKDGGILIVEQDLVRVSDLKQGRQGLQHSRHSHRRGTRQAHGAEFGDGGILHRRHPTAGTRCGPQSRSGFRPAFRDLNLQAFEKGFEYGATALNTNANPSDAVLAAQYSPE